MDKLKMHSPNLTQDNIARIRDLFPGCVTEAKGEDGSVKLAVDFDQLRQELSESIVEGPQERYHLNWPGKREALLAANAPIAKTLRLCREESVDFDSTKNLFIEGDNLDALKLLQETYLDKVKMIYIDPPYNTGKDFIYKDSFASDQNAHQVASGERSEEGARLVVNPEGNGRFHSNWLTMIAPRIRLAKNMLRQDGAIFVSCDEGEHPRLRLIMDEIFGQSNFVADMVWAAGRKNDSRLVSVSHEYIVCYARDVEYLRAKQITWRQRKKGLDEIYAQYERLKRQHGKDYMAMTEGLRVWYRSLADGHPSKDHKHYNNIVSVQPTRLSISNSLCRWPERQQFIYAVVRPDWEFFQRIFQPACRFNTIEFGGGEQTLYGSGALSCAFRTSEQPIFLAQCNRTDGVFHWVVVDGQVAACGITNQSRPAFEAVIDGFCQAAAVGNRRLQFGQPVVHCRQFRCAVLSTMLCACHTVHVLRFYFDGVQPRNVGERLFGHGVSASSVQVEEFPARMRPATKFGYATAKQRFVSGIIIYHQGSAPILQEISSMFTATADLVVKHHNRRTCVKDVGAVTPQISAPSLARSGFKLLHRGFVGMHYSPLLDQLHQPVGQRL